jgi:AcrR family transcriptional regulator
MREITRERILDAADELFLNNGFTRTTVQDIAAYAGYTTGAIYSNFGGKADLFLAVSARRWPRQRQVWREALVTEKPTDVATTMGAALKVAISEPQWYAALFEFMSYASRHEELAEKVAEFFKGSDVDFVDIFRDARIEPPIPLERFVQVLLGLMRGLAWTWVAIPGAADETLFADGMALLLTGHAQSSAARRRSPAVRRSSGSKAPARKR